MNSPVTPAERMARACAAYRSQRPYFYIFIRPMEAALLGERLQGCARPVLDFGCGDGFFARQLGLEKIELGLDVDPALEPAALQVYERFVLGRPGDPVALPAGSVATVFSNSVFEHLTDPDATLAALARVLRPGGRLLATVTTREWENSLGGGRWLGAPYRRAMRRVQRHHTLWRAQRWEEALQKAGFEHIQMTGYLEAELVRRVEWFHYLSAPAWIAYRLSGRLDSGPAGWLSRLCERAAPPAAQPVLRAADCAPCVLIEARKRL